MAYRFNEAWDRQQRERGIIIPDLRSSNPDLLLGWQQIADFLSMKLWKTKSLRKELMTAGAIFYTLKGKPSHKIVCCFKTVLMRWVILKAKKGEVI